TTNLVSGFLITDRMLKMFKRREPKAALMSFLPPVLLLGMAHQGGALAAPAGWQQVVAQLAYLVATALFVLSLKWLNTPSTARQGVIAGEVGMLLGVAGTLLLPQVQVYAWIFIAMALGTVLGVIIAVMTPMTAVPQRTAFSHAFGGAAVGLVGTAKYYFWLGEAGMLTHFKMGVIAFEVLLGFLTFTGSLMAFGKLADLLPGRPMVYRGQNLINFTLLALALVIGIVLTVDPTQQQLYPFLIVLSLLFGVLLILPIGGADMPTVISLLNSYAGLSASAMGFVLDNKLLIVAGALDGSSGLILSIIMCRAMNRSFTNVLFGAFGQVQTATGKVEDRTVRSASPEEAASILEAASSVVVIPGYGMAVAQAQHKVRELYDTLSRRGIDVKFAIHPVAGRMPGHMNVLLAEADIPYDRMVEMDDINGDFPQTDVALVIGANDVTNPAARHDKTSPIYGMPILDVDKARTVMVIKRSMSAGFAGVENELYFMDKTLMLFGDAKGFVGEIVKELPAPAAAR
ncbi:MAG TPA: NAD(P)(+) transhydrogenase (Re/Si-specific) subunit beta, partial [Fimbriimonadaceae bacterium]|nr:NAD(P)(+) transhydrogenase (Re/Si-specific) subunit beta [Fimbriimonadaceae bacterium]